MGGAVCARKGGWTLFLGLVPRRRLGQLCQAAAAAPPARVAASPPPLPAGMTPPPPRWPRRCRCPAAGVVRFGFSPAPRGKLAVRYIRDANPGAPEPPGPGGVGLLLLHPLSLGASVRPSRRLGRARCARRDARRAAEPGAFRGKYRPSPPPSHRALVPSPPPPAPHTPAAPLAPPGRQVVCKHLRAGGGGSCRSPGCEGRDAVCARCCACVPAALQWQLPSRRLLTPALQCSRS